jgi:hypothetical protein
MLVRGHKVYNTLYANVYTLAKEYEAIQNPTPKQEWLQAILQLPFCEPSSLPSRKLGA